MSAVTGDFDVFYRSTRGGCYAIRIGRTPGEPDHFEPIPPNRAAQVLREAFPAIKVEDA